VLLFKEYVRSAPDSRKQAQQIVKSDAAKATGSDKTALEQVATSPLVFPTAKDYSKLYRYRDLTNAEDRALLSDPTFRDTVAEGILVAVKRLYLLGQNDQPTGTFTFGDLLRHELAKAE